jgi:hypothetical protein
MYYYGSGAQDLLAPARRASLLLIVLGSITILFAFCFGGSSLMMDQILAQGKMPPEAMNNMTPQQMKLLMLVMGVVLLVVGAITVLVGIIARRGTRGPVIAALTVTSLFALYLLEEVVRAIVLVALQGNPTVLLGVCVIIVPLVAYGVGIFWLIQALRAAGKIGVAQQQQYQMQMWQMQQQQAWQQAGGYGYALPNAPQAPPAPTPPPPPGDSPQQPPQSQP